VNRIILSLVLAGGVTGLVAAPPQGNVLTVDVRVSDRTGQPIGEAEVTLEGTSARDGSTGSTGVVTFRNVTPGPYRVRISRDGFVTLEKETVIEGSARVSVEAALSPASDRAIRLVGPAGPPNLVSIPDLAEDLLDNPSNVAERPIGCSGEQFSRVIMLRDRLPSAQRDDADETLYVIAGEASVTIGTLSQVATAGWLGIVPRGSSYAVVRRGRNPVILLSIVAGQPCSEAGSLSIR